MTATQAPHAASATLHMVAVSLASTPEPAHAARSPIGSALLRQACLCVEFHLSEPALAAGDVCNAMKVLRATLYRILSAYGDISNHIREGRLACTRCYRRGCWRSCIGAGGCECRRSVGAVAAGVERLRRTLTGGHGVEKVGLPLDPLDLHAIVMDFAAHTGANGESGLAGVCGEGKKKEVSE